MKAIEPAVALCQSGRPAEAADAMLELLDRHPDNPHLWSAWSEFLRTAGRSREALNAAQRARELDRSIMDPELVFQMSMEAMDIEGAVDIAHACSEAEPGNSAHWSRWLLHLQYLPLPAHVITEAHANWGRRYPDPGRTFNVDRTPSRRLRLGYVSPFRSDWAVQHFLNPVFSEHDPDQVEVFAYQTLRDGDSMTEILKSKVPHWRETAGWDDAAFAGQVLRDRIDVLVDLTGHSWNNRLGAMAQRLAPLQVTWLGYPGTTGLPAMDIRISDAVADPPGAESDYTERLVRLPGGFLCYQAPDQAPEVNASPCAANGFITFGCTNIPAKLSEPTLALWAEVLRACPGSRMVFKFARGNWQDLGDNLAGRFERLGIDASRLGILPFQTSYANHLSAYGLLDIILDPFPYNGTTTTCEALWMGVPVIALRGGRHAARVGASILTRLGLDELIGEDEASYLAIAAAMAKDPLRLKALRAGMRARMKASPLMDAVRFTRELEAAYRQEWTAWCQRAS